MVCCCSRSASSSTALMRVRNASAAPASTTGGGDFSARRSARSGMTVASRHAPIRRSRSSTADASACAAASRSTGGTAAHSRRPRPGPAGRCRRPRPRLPIEREGKPPERRAFVLAVSAMINRASRKRRPPAARPRCVRRQRRSVKRTPKATARSRSRDDGGGRRNRAALARAFDAERIERGRRLDMLDRGVGTSIASAAGSRRKSWSAAARWHRRSSIRTARCRCRARRRPGPGRRRSAD